MSTFREDLHLGRKVPMVETDDIANGSVTKEKINKETWAELVAALIKNNGATAIGADGYWYVDGKKTDVKAHGNDGKDADVWSIGSDGYWYLNGEKTEYLSKGEDGNDGRDMQMRLSSDGQSIETSVDGITWRKLTPNFNKMRVLGFVSSYNELPKNPEIGDIYGVWVVSLNEKEDLEVVPAEHDNTSNGASERYALGDLLDPGEFNPSLPDTDIKDKLNGEYVLYVNTVLDWEEELVISKVYSYESELPSSTSDGTSVLVPVRLNKERVDGYKVYRYSKDAGGWLMILDAAEIYASKDDIVNRGDNVYAIVQGDKQDTYLLYKRVVGWRKFGTSSDIHYQVISDIDEGGDNDIPSIGAIRKVVKKIEDSRVYLTEAAYDALIASGNVNPDVEYNVYEEEE